MNTINLTLVIFVCYILLNQVALNRNSNGHNVVSAQLAGFTCSQKYVRESACKSDPLCRWNKNSNSCSSICAGLDLAACSRKDGCQWYPTTLKCDYKLVPTAQPTNNPSKKPTNKPTINTNPTTKSPTKKPSTKYPTLRSLTPKPTFKVTTPTTKSPTAFDMGTDAPTTEFDPNIDCTRYRDESSCDAIGCTWYTNIKKCQKPCTYVLQNVCLTDDRCMWLSGRCQLQTRSPSVAPTTFYPTPPTTSSPTTLGVPVYVNILLPQKSQGPNGRNIWDYIQDRLASILKITNKREVYIRLCGSSSFRDDLPPIDRVGGSPECAMYEMVGNNDPNSDYLKANSAKMLINIFGSVFSEGGPQAEIYYKRVYIVLNSILKPLNGYVLDYHPPVTSAIKKPNILMMVADDLGYGDVGYQACTGPSTTNKLCSPKEITPNIDILAKHQSSIVFDRFYTYSSCGPSRVSILSGRQPGRDCILENPGGFGDPPNIPTNLLTIAEAAETAGYKTFHVGKWHAGTMHGDNTASTAHPGQLGYDEWYATPKWTATKNLNCGCFNADDYGNLCDTGMYTEKYFLNEYADLDKDGNRKFLMKNNIYRFPCTNYYFVNEDQPTHNVKSENVGGWPTPMDGDDANYVVDRFSKFITKHDKSIPFFATLWFHNPHAPFISTDNDHLTQAKLLVEKDAGARWCGELYDVYDDQQLGRPTCRSKFGDAYCDQLCHRVKAEYYSSILEMDASIGRIMKLLDDNNYRQNTMVIFFSDNGPARYDTTGNGNRYVGPGSTAGLPGYKFDLREGGLRVPAFIYFPQAITQNIHVKTPVSIVDLLPTMVELVGNNQQYLNKMSRGILDGTSLLPYIRGYTDIKRSKPIGFVTLNGYQYLLFDELAVSKASADKNLKVYNVAANGLTANVEKVIATKDLKLDSDDLVQRFKAWTSTYKSAAYVWPRLAGGASGDTDTSSSGDTSA